MAQRILRVNELIKQEAGKLFLTEMNFPVGVLVTVMEVETSKDLRYADIFISVFPFEKADEMLEALKEHIYFLQKIINKKLSMKPLPRIRFVIDERGERAGRIEELIKKSAKS
jgi:ribosome-binding factor A